ncbi:MAG: hypothetical protein AAB699_00050 [Patescibacteria group bacterium]
MAKKASKEIAAVLKPYNAEIKRHMSALSEDFQGRVKVVAEQFGGLNGKIDRLQDTVDSHAEMFGKIQHTIDAHTEMFGKIQHTIDAHTEMIGILMVDVSTIKANVEFLKGGLKKKVDYDEFLALERRLSLVEARMHK